MSRAGVVRPGEGEALHHGVAGERRPDHGARAGDEVEHPGGQSGLHEALDQPERRERRGGCGLEDHGVAVDERRRDLPGGDGDGEVPRCDGGDHAERLAAAEEHGVRRVGRQDVPAHPPALTAEVAEDVARAEHLAGRLGERLALLARERARDLVQALGEQFGRLEEDGAARRRRRGRPGRERLGGGGDRMSRVRGGRADGNTARTSSGSAGLLVSKLAWSLAADPLAADQVLARLHRPPPVAMP